ncbi:MAG: sulfocyanin-like copper-binding protein [Actinomycetota bacterium]
MTPRARLAIALVSLCLLCVGCAGSGAQPAATGTPDAGIATTLTDFKITTAEAEAVAGRVAFDLQNDGPSDHTFYLARTDLAEDALPVVDHVVNLGALAVVAKTGLLGAGADATVAADLPAGTYVLFCNLPGHYESDMHAAFTVT